MDFSHFFGLNQCSGKQTFGAFCGQSTQEVSETRVPPRQKTESMTLTVPFHSRKSDSSSGPWPRSKDSSKDRMFSNVLLFCALVLAEIRQSRIGSPQKQAHLQPEALLPFHDRLPPESGPHFTFWQLTDQSSDVTFVRSNSCIKPRVDSLQIEADADLPARREDQYMGQKDGA